MGRQMLRAVLERLKAQDRLRECAVPVDPRFELGAVLSAFNNEQPILFRNVKGSDLPVVGAVYGNRSIILDLLGTTTEKRLFKLMEAISLPSKPRLLERGPVQENVVTTGIDLLKMLPVPTSNERDAAPYLCASAFVVRDTETGKIQMAVRRIQVLGGNKLYILVSGASPHLLGEIRRCAERGRPLECAVVLGYDAPFLLASQIGSGKYGLDKYEVDSTLRGEPLELVRCRTVDLEVPAWAEIVLEGKIEPGRAEPEGPFAELMGYYSTVAPAPVMEVSAVTHRNAPIFQHAFPCKEEHLAYGMIKEAEIFAALAHTVDVRDVNLTLGGGCRLHAVISIRKRAEGDGKSTILGTLGAYKDIKHVVVVDDDVNIYNMAEVEAAVASRFQASRDLVVVSGALGSPLEASHMERGVSDKMGLDATKPLGDKAALYEAAVIPGFDKVKSSIDRYFSDGVDRRR
ncbi:UbiD family decarboxylase [Fretibacterium sp. OH1220_COT-178]|nr:UbiD family decarboxylase [Fretibacterium sp. OH1220_COT-178]